MSFLADTAQDSPSDADAPPRSQLLNQHSTDRYRYWVSEGVSRIADTLDRVDQPSTGISPAELQPAISGVDLDQPLADPAAALDELESLYLKDAVYFHHPRYLAHLNCPVVIPAVLGEVVLSAINSSLDTWDQSIGATLIERRLIDWTTQRVGLGADADGVFTSGGTQSNLQAMLIAREEAVRRHQAGGNPPSRTEILPRLRVLASSCAHFSVQKAASLLGLAPDAVVPVPCDPSMRMRPAALAAELDRCERDGLVVMAVVATAGTTDFGSIDPLPQLAEVCERHRTWLHVDAAYGCGLLVSRRRHLLTGIERADSVTIDYHKSFFQPVSSSAIVVRDRASLQHVTYHADYLNPQRELEDRVPNQVDKSIQTTRRFDALKLWLTLRIMGADGIGKLFDEVIDLADRAWARLDADPRFEVVVRPRLSTLVFRYLPPPGVSTDLANRMNSHARDAIFRAGRAMVAGTRLAGKQYLKFTLLNPQTTLSDITDVLDLIAENADHFLAERADPVLGAVRVG